MQRQKIEKRIQYIISYMKDANLHALLQNSKDLFSDTELETILSFLESGKQEVLHDLVRQKIHSYKDQLGELKQLQGKLERKINEKQEAKEVAQEQQEIEQMIALK